MAREDWQDREEERRRAAIRGREDYGQVDYSDDYAYDPRRRAGYRAEEDVRPRADDYGQADYSNDYTYDPERGGAYRRYSAEDRDYGPRADEGDYRPAGQPRSWIDRAGEFFTGPRTPGADARARPRRRGPSDRVLWAVIVEDAEVTLNGKVRHKADRRRIEDVADIDGVRHVQNNLRVHEHGHWTFL